MDGIITSDSRNHFYRGTNYHWLDFISDAARGNRKRYRRASLTRSNDVAASYAYHGAPHLIQLSY